jgi:hypothetical protein
MRKGWLDKYEQGGLVLKKKTKDNYGKKANPNDVKASVGPNFVGLGYDTTGRKYSPAWGGQFQMGGSLPGAVGHIYARYNQGGYMPGDVDYNAPRKTGSAPSNGPYAKKTKASAQNGKEMKYYQEGLDFKPKTISQDGSEIPVDSMGYWNPENVGNPVIIPSNDITMEGVDQPLLGISDTGDVQYMMPGEDYEFDGEYVTEYPVAKKGISVNNADAQPIEKLDQSLNFTNYNKPTKGGWLNKYQGGGQLKKPTLKEISQIPEKRYEPSDAVKNIKATLSAADLATIPFAGNPIGFAVNRGIGALNSIADATTSLRYAIDGQWKNAGIDFGEAVLDLVPFKKGRLSKLDKSSNKALKIGKGVSYADDFQDVVPEKEKGGWLNKYK